MLEDIGSTEGLYSLLCSFVEGMKGRREAASQKNQVETDQQKSIWHVREAGIYCTCARELARGLGGMTCTSRGMCAFARWLTGYVGTEGFQDMARETDRLLSVLDSLRMKLVYENERVEVSLEEVPGSYDHFLGKCFPGRERQMKSPFGAAGELTELEQELLKALRRKCPEFFQGVARFYQEHAVYGEEILFRFATQVCFYLSFLGFEGKMLERGFSFARPSVLREEGMYATGLYDLALACRGDMTPGQIRANDIAYREGERFFVLTGPNQGGKTTFARSLGQLVYLTAMGLDVAAASANVPVFPDICTHFSVEESTQTGRGKLVEELMRLAPMMDTGPQARRGTFVILNELFTTAASYDACRMGKRVLDHFIAMGCKGIYVTHLRELARETGQVISLRAMTDERECPTYEITRGEAPEWAGAERLARKHRLTYGQVKERLGCGNVPPRTGGGGLP